MVDDGRRGLKRGREKRWIGGAKGESAWSINGFPGKRKEEWGRKDRRRLAAARRSHVRRDAARRRLAIFAKLSELNRIMPSRWRQPCNSLNWREMWLSRVTYTSMTSRPAPRASRDLAGTLARWISATSMIQFCRNFHRRYGTTRGSRFKRLCCLFCRIWVEFNGSGGCLELTGTGIKWLVEIVKRNVDKADVL